MVFTLFIFFSYYNLDGERLDYRQLAFYPLLILEKLLCRFSPDQVGLQKAVDFRHQALKLGVMVLFRDISRTGGWISPPRPEKSEQC